ncbi:MAG: hypothetical protein A4E27_01725 [Methanobacterium sp. PtaU1.Bin242]|nr:MAG: hypothetical protein A4E27_01725 [Methanobacterium sp. PtaU1.Bin242]
MEIKSRITFTYRTEKEAQIALDSLKPDNMGFLETHVEFQSLICDLESRPLKTALATIDDLLFCEMISERIIDFTNNEE